MFARRDEAGAASAPKVPEKRQQLYIKQLLFLAASNRMSLQASGFDSPIVTGYGPCHCVCLFLGTSVQSACVVDNLY